MYLNQSLFIKDYYNFKKTFNYYCMTESVLDVVYRADDNYDESQAFKIRYKKKSKSRRIKFYN